MIDSELPARLSSCTQNIGDLWQAAMKETEQKKPDILKIWEIYNKMHIQYHEMNSLLVRQHFIMKGALAACELKKERETLLNVLPMFMEAQKLMNIASEGLQMVSALLVTLSKT